jgi:predicted secreted protein
MSMVGTAVAYEEYHEHNGSYHEGYAKIGVDDKSKDHFPLGILISWEGDPSSYGKVILSVHAISPAYEEIKFNLNTFGDYVLANMDDVDDSNNPHNVINFPYWFYDHRPTLTEICVENVDSDKRDCTDAYSNDRVVEVHLSN